MNGDRVVDRGSMFALALLGLGVVSLYWTVVPRMVHDWWKDPNFSHGFLVPVFSAYLIHEKSRDLRLLRPESSATAGLFLVVCGLAMLIVGKAGGEYFTMRSSIVVLLSGIFFIMFGKEGFLLCLFPLMFLFFMVPIPYILYDAIAFPLKMAASWIGEHALSAVGIPVLRDGNIIMLPNIRLEVADACSGIRSLMSLMALATVASYFLNLRIALGAVLFVSSVPVSVGTNSLRIFATGILSNRYGEKAAEGFFHDFSGWLVFAAGAFVILLIGVLLRKIRDSL